MSLAKMLFIGALILLGVWYFLPNEFEKGKNWIMGQTNTNTNTNTNTWQDYINYSQTNYTYTQTDNNSTDETSNTTDESDTEEDEETVTPVLDDPCLWNYKGLPNYIGTSKEGNDCASFNTSNEECLAYPPLNYDGYINIAQMESSPIMKCCNVDGMCHWR